MRFEGGGGGGGGWKVLFALGKLQQLHFVLVVQKLSALTKKAFFLKKIGVNANIAWNRYDT